MSSTLVSVMLVRDATQCSCSARCLRCDDILHRVHINSICSSVHGFRPDEEDATALNGLRNTTNQGVKKMEPSDLRCQVLLAEDNPVNTELVRAILAIVDCDVTAVARGADAIEVFKERRFHLILLDFHLLDMNGDQVATAMRAIEATRQVKPTRIAALTASAMPDELRRCIASGMDEVLAKPIDTPRLRALAVEAFQRECATHT